MDRLSWMKQLKNDPVHKKIKQTKDALVNDDHFDLEEAIQVSVDEKKFLTKTVKRLHL